MNYACNYAFPQDNQHTPTARERTSSRKALSRLRARSLLMNYDLLRGSKYSHIFQDSPAVDFYLFLSFISADSVARLHVFRRNRFRV